MLKVFAPAFYAHIAISIVCIAISYICAVIMLKNRKEPISHKEVEEKSELLESMISYRFGINLSATEVVFLSFFVPVLNLYMAKRFIEGTAIKSN